MKFISLGGWCGTTISLRGNYLYNEAFPFDNIRSSFDGVINCIENNFLNFFPKKINVDIIPNYPYSGLSYRGQYCGFYHHDLTDFKVINDFNRRIERFNNLLKNTIGKIVFIRTISTHDYNDETKLANYFINLINKKFYSLDFLLIFIIPGQDKSMYYKKINDKTHIFTLNDKSNINNNLTQEYKPIYKFLINNDLFKITPKENNINIKNFNRFVKVNGIPFTQDDSYKYMSNINEVYIFLKKNKNNKLRYKIIYEIFKKNVMQNKLLLKSFNSCDGFGEIPFTWSWKLLVDSMPNNFKFLEIGVYKGRIISQIGLLSKIINKKCSIYGITPLSTAGDKYSRYVDNNYLEIIQNNFKKLNTNITNLTIIKGYSQDAKVVEKALNKSKYNMIFIDGSHDYNDVIFDILTYSKMLTINGYLIMDDSSLYLPDSYGMFKGHPDVSKACIDYLDTNPNFEELYAIGHNRVWKKIK